jgi:RimJ/RimL family protein N-acetyltransferase
MFQRKLRRVEGPNLALRLVCPDDAEYVFALRTNPAYNLYLSEVRGTASDQRRWIEDYKAREADLQELYYVIERKDGVRCGLVRLYDIGPSSFTWGSWILDHNKTRKAALESAILSLGVGFTDIGLSSAMVEVRRENERARNFYVRFGMTELRSVEDKDYFICRREIFEANRERFMTILQAEG